MAVSVRAIPPPLSIIRCPHFTNHKIPLNKSGLSTPVLNISSKLRVPYHLSDGQNRHFHKLPSGLNMEVIAQRGKVEDPTGNLSPKCPLVFVHGSFHAAWCWAVHWLPFFANNGYDCYAISLLGQGESDVPTGPVAASLQTHASDVAHFIREEIGSQSVLIGHSFGGLIVQSYISNMIRPLKSSNSEREDSYPELAGAILICSVPPSGNSGLVWRYVFSRPAAAFKVTLSLAAKAFATSLPLCKETFFCEDMGDRLVQRYQELMKESSRMPLFDLRKLNASLPVPPVPNNCLSILVMGAANDFIVDNQGLNETAKFYGILPVVVEGVAHDMMLDTCWERGARVILSWLNQELNKLTRLSPGEIME
ncbi:hypothetical protein AMTR_s00079p00138710 [Amborella trichopoda]|uniref:AB hydrolase-1 domain-containing protein n=2 Tax=Amborella trichopoda TaxID=13333 RepID=W1PAF1_AMBTC|nr:hypothetical protein AMTR_s00079p00138710 [Amborella trichopoda]